MRTGFSKDALERLAATDGLAAGATGGLRAEAFAQFEAMPVPSPETEEWRYTDLRELDLGTFEPRAQEPTAANLDDVDPEILEAAGHVGERAGLAIQHNSSVITAHLDPVLAGQGVTFVSLDEAPAHLVEERLHVAVPTGRTKFTAMHAAFR